MEATRLGLSAVDLTEMQTVLDNWANQCVLQAKQRLTEAFLPFIQELVLPDYKEILALAETK